MLLPLSTQHSALSTMPQRIAATMALIAFAVCLIAGMSADNTITTTLSRALVAMGGTFLVGAVVGAMAQRMLDENIKSEQNKPPAEQGGAK